MSRTGGQLLADQLAVHGTEVAFCVPGESYLDLLDGLYSSPIRLITCRQEASAANMAEAYGKLTGRPGVCIVTRGPGATHASVGVHTAFQDSTPMILFVGQVSSVQDEREAFQEIDYRRMFGPLAKWVAQIDRRRPHPRVRGARLLDGVHSGGPARWCWHLPEDMLAGRGTPRRTCRSGASQRAPRRPTSSAARPARARRAAVRDRRRRRAGRRGRRMTCSAFSRRTHLPAGAAFRRQDSFDNRLPNYAGDVGIGDQPGARRAGARCRSAARRRRRAWAR